MFEQGDDLNLDAGQPQPEKSNRTFIIAAGIMAGVVLISIIAMAVYALVYLPRQKAGQTNIQATIEFQNALIAQAMTQTMQSVASATVVPPTNTAVPPTSTPLVLATATPLMAVASPTSLVVNVGMTATWSALNNQVAAGVGTPTATVRASAMPASGFAEDIGLPGLLVMAVALVVVILLARRLRSASI